MALQWSATLLVGAMTKPLPEMLSSSPGLSLGSTHMAILICRKIQEYFFLNSLCFPFSLSVFLLCSFFLSFSLLLSHLTPFYSWTFCCSPLAVVRSISHLKTLPRKAFLYLLSFKFSSSLFLLKSSVLVSRNFYLLLLTASLLKAYIYYFILPSFLYFLWFLLFSITMLCYWI